MVIKKCKKHPKYKAKRVPTSQCTECMTLYIAMGKLIRKPNAPPTKVFPDKTKYNRRNKHKEKE